MIDLTNREKRIQFYSNIRTDENVNVIAKNLVQANAEFNRQILISSDGFSSISSELIASREWISEDLEDISRDIQEVAKGINGLQSIFEWGLTEVIWQLEQNRNELKEIKEVLTAPLNTQAKELRQRAEQSLKNAWYEEALEDFIESEKKNKFDYLVHISLGIIYYSHRKDLEKALEYFEKAIKYSKPYSAYYCSYSLLYKANILELKGQVEEAWKASREAIDLSPDFAEALYQHSKYSALTGKEFESSLEKAIALDRNYCLKALTEECFNRIGDRVNQFLQRLIVRFKTKIQYQLSEAKKKVQIVKEIMKDMTADNIAISSNNTIEDRFNRIADILSGIDKSSEKNSYFEVTQIKDTDFDTIYTILSEIVEKLILEAEKAQAALIQMNARISGAIMGSNARKNTVPGRIYTLVTGKSIYDRISIVLFGTLFYLIPMLYCLFSTNQNKLLAFVPALNILLCIALGIIADSTAEKIELLVLIAADIIAYYALVKILSVCKDKTLERAKSKEIMKNDEPMQRISSYIARLKDYKADKQINRTI